MAIDFNGINNSGKPQNNADRRVETLDRGNTGSRTQASGQSAGQAASSLGGDTISLTDTAARLKSVESRLADLPVVDSERVEGVQRALTSGNYAVDAERVAGKMIAFERQLTGKG